MDICLQNSLHENTMRKESPAIKGKCLYVGSPHFLSPYAA